MSASVFARFPTKRGRSLARRQSGVPSSFRGRFRRDSTSSPRSRDSCRSFRAASRFAAAAFAKASRRPSISAPLALPTFARRSSDRTSERASFSVLSRALRWSAQRSGFASTSRRTSCGVQPIQVSRTRSCGSALASAAIPITGRMGLAPFRMSRKTDRPGVGRYSRDHVWRKYRQMSSNDSPVVRHSSSAVAISSSGAMTRASAAMRSEGGSPATSFRRTARSCPSSTSDRTDTRCPA